MKKVISLLTAVIMILAAVPFGVFAAPTGSCLKFEGDECYAYFDKFKTNGSDSKISFDLSQASNSEGAPILQINIGAITIASDYVQIGSQKKSISWGAAELTHWRKIDIVYSGGTCILSIDGNEVLKTSGSCRTEGLVFIGWPGSIRIDNLNVVSSGTTVFSMDFENAAEFSSSLSGDSTAVRDSVPANSFYDYEEVILPDNVSYIFSNALYCKKIGVSETESVLAGDADKNGRLTSADSQILKAIISGIYSEAYDVSVFDLDSDNAISMNDSLRFKEIASGKREAFYVNITNFEPSEFSFPQKSAKLTAKTAVSGGADAVLLMDNKISPDDYKFAVITYMTPNSSDEKNSDAAVQSGFGAYGNFVTYDLICDGKFHSQIVDLSEISTWNGDTAALRFFVGANAGDSIYIDSVIFTANRSRAASAAASRELVKKIYGIYDVPEVSDKIGYEDDNGNYVIRFDEEEKIDLKVLDSNNSSFAYEDNSLRVKAVKGSDPSIYIDLLSEEISANNYKYIAYTYKVPTTNGRNEPRGNIYYVCGDIDDPTGGYESDVFNCTKNGQYATCIIDLSSKSNWSGDIKGIRVDYFTDCANGDIVYIDSLIFSETESSALKAGRTRVKERNGGSDSSSTAEVWNEYWAYNSDANRNEYVHGSGSDVQMYFRFNSAPEKFTARSLGDRMARAISEATGYNVSCQVYSGFVDLKSSFENSSSPSGNVYYTLTYEGSSYVVYLKTTIIKDPSYTDVLDGTASDVDPVYGNTNTWFTSGLNVTDSVSLPVSTSGLAAHSNHETRIVDTPYGTFAAIPMSSDSSSWGTIGGASFSIFRIYDDGSTKKLASYDFANHTSKPNIMYAADGMVYVVCADDQGSSMSVLTLYFDPSKPNSDGTYNIKGGRSTRSYSGGAAPGGYGYIQPVLDDKNGKIYVIACGGSNAGYFAWSIYNYKSHSWESSYSTVIDSYRHCYIYAYSDGGKGIYLVAGRDVLLSTLGLAGTVYGADYAWDEVNLFHFTDMNSVNYTRTVVNVGDYTQTARELYPTTANNKAGDTFISSDGYLHVLSTKIMHGRFHHDIKYVEMWHAVYDVSTPGMKPVELYNKPISFVSPTNNYSMRMTESTSGQVYIIAVPTDRDARCEIWRETDGRAFEFEFVGCKKFSDTKQCTTSVIIGNNRNGSCRDNTVSCFYPTSQSGGTVYKFFTVELPG